jgi:3-methyladenine DNA glycosylase AlkD
VVTTSDDVVQQLTALGKASNVEGMGRFGMATDHRLGVSVPDIRKVAKQVGKDHDLALALWETGIQEARIAAALIAEPNKLSERQMEDWVMDLNSWDVCDQVCLNLFDKSPLAVKKIHDWSEREEEFVKRAAYSLIAGLAWHDKTAEDQRFLDLLPVIRNGATDDRNYVKKAVSWALRHIGKRNLALNAAAIKEAERIRQIDSKAARWIASEVIRELQSEKIQARLMR